VLGVVGKHVTLKGGTLREHDQIGLKEVVASCHGHNHRLSGLKKSVHKEGKVLLKQRLLLVPGPRGQNRS